MASSSKASLHGIAPELRDEIYKHLLTYTTTIDHLPEVYRSTFLLGPDEIPERTLFRRKFYSSIGNCIRKPSATCDEQISL